MTTINQFPTDAPATDLPAVADPFATPSPPVESPEMTGPPVPDRILLRTEIARQPGGRLDADTILNPTPERVREFMRDEPNQGRVDRFFFEMLLDAEREEQRGDPSGMAGVYRGGLNSYLDERTSRGEEPFQYLDKERTRTEEKIARERIPFFKTLFADPLKMEDALPAEQREGFRNGFEGSLNPVRDRQQTAGMMLVSTLMDRPMDEVKELWGVYRQNFAEDNFGVPKGQKVDDAQFYTLAGKFYQDEEANLALYQDVAAKAQAAAIQGKPLSASLAINKDRAKDRWKRFEPAARAGHASIIANFEDSEIMAARGLFEAVADLEGKQVEDIAKGDGKKAAWVIALEAYGGANQQGRDKILSLIALQAQAEGQSIDNYLERVATAIDSGTQGLFLGVSGWANRTTAEDMQARVDKETDPTKKREAQANANYFKGKAAFAQDMRTAGVRVRRYIDQQREGFWDSIGDYGVLAAESLPTMVGAALPYGTGLPLVLSSYYDRNLSKMRRDAPNVPESEFRTTAFASAAIEAGIDRLQWATLEAKLPALNAKLLQYGKPGAIGALVTRGLYAGTLETGQEVLQDLTPTVVREIASAFNEDIPGASIEAAIEQELDTLGDIAGVSLIYGFIGATGHTIAEHIAAPRLAQVLQDRDGLALSGHSPETIDRVTSLARENPAAAAEALRAAALSTPKEVRQANIQAAQERMQEEAPGQQQTVEDAKIPTLEKQEDGKIVVNYPDGPAVLLDTEEQALEAVREWEANEDVDVTRATREYLRFLEDYHSANPEVTFVGKQTDQDPTLETWAGNSRERLTQANARVDIMLRQAGEDMGIARPLLSEVPILGTSRNIRANGITRMVAEIHKRGNPLTVVEEMGESLSKWLMESGKVPETRVIRWIRETEQATGRKILSDQVMNLDDDLRTQEIAEGFSYVAKNNAVGRIQDSQLPSPVKAFFRAFREQLRAALSIAVDFARLRQEGKVDPEFGYWLDLAAGLEPEYQMENEARRMEAEMLAESMEGFTEVQDALRGKLPHPDALERAGDPLAAEVRGLWDAMVANPENGASKGARTRKAREFFASEGADLDALRRSLNEQGFSFATPAEMIDAADLSINRGKRQYGTTDPDLMGGDVTTFSVGRAIVTTTPQTRMLEGADESPTVVGPATFSIEAWHGTPHKVDKFSTERIGTGEGRQVFGWGLYFTETKEIAESYRQNLSYKETRKQFLELLPEDSDFADVMDLVGTDHFTPYQERILRALEADDWLGFDYPAQAISAAYSKDLPDFDPSQELKDAVAGSGNTYKVSVDVNPEDLLDWDKPLTDHPETIKSALEKEFGKLVQWEMTMGEWHNWMTNPRHAETDPVSLSEDLRSSGIPGIQYLDGDSRAKGEGSRNFVMFDDSRITITEANGRPVTMSTFSIALRTDPLLQAIEEKIKSPEKKADIYKKMRTRVGDVKRRFEDRRIKGDFDRPDGIDTDRFSPIRDLAILEAIAKSMPMELRGKITGSFRAIADLRTTKARQRYMANLLPKIENALEGLLQRHFRTAIRRQMKQAEAKVSEARTTGGKIGALGHAVFDQVKAAMKLVDDPASEGDKGQSAFEKANDMAEDLRAKLEGTPDLTDDHMAELDARIVAIELFGDYGNADSHRLEQALGFLQGTYAEGRQEWLTTLRTRRDQRQARVGVIEAAMGIQGPITDAMRNAARRRDQKILKQLDEGVMSMGLSGSQKIRRLGELSDDPAITALTDDMEYAFLAAENAESDLNQADNEALAQAFREIFRVKFTGSVAARLRDLSTAKGAAPVEKIEGRKVETVKVPLKYVENILAGEYDALEAGGEKLAEELRSLDQMDLDALSEAWDAFNELPENEQSRKRIISFERVKAEGSRQTIGEVSQLEGLQLYLTMRQPDQMAKLERLGYDAETLEQLEDWLKPEAKALGQWMVDRIGVGAFTLDSLHRAEKGVGLKLVENYFPVRNDVARADTGGLSLDGGRVKHTGKSIGSVKERVSNLAPPAYVNAIAVFLSGQAQRNFWTSHVAAIREWGGLIRDERAASVIKTRMGASYYSSLTRMMDRIEAGGSLNGKALMGYERAMKALLRTYALGTLGARVSTLAINTTAAINVGLEIPANELAAGLADLINRPEAFKDAFNSPAIQRRFKQGTSVEAQIAKSSGPSASPIMAQLSAAAEAGVLPIGLVDTYANVAGAAVVWEHTRKQLVEAGLTEEAARAEADKKVERLMLRAAQPTSRLGKSEIEQMVGESPLTAPLLLFTSETRKTLAIAYMAARELATDKGTYGKPMAAQQLFVSMVIMQSAAFLIQSAYAALAKAKDDEPEDFTARLRKKLFDAQAWGYALTTQHLRAVPFFGEFWDKGMAAAFDQKVFDSSQNPLNRASRVLFTAKDAKTAEDAVEKGIKIVQGLGSVIPGGAVFAQGGNAAEFVTGLATSNGVAFSEADHLKRIKSRFSAYSRSLTELYGKTEGEDGKTDKEVQKKKHAALVDRLRADLAPLTPEMRKKALEAISAPEEVKKKAMKLLGP